ARAITGIDRHMRDSQPIVAEKGDDDLGAWVREHGDPVAGPDPHRPQRARVSERELIEIVDGVGLSFKEQRGSAVPSFQLVEEPVDAAGWLHTDPAPRNCSRTRGSRVSSLQGPERVTRPVSRM